MKQLRFIHTADWHADADPKKQKKLEASLDQMVAYCSNVKVNAIIHAGDVFEKSQKYQANSGVPVVLKYLHKLAKLVDFIFITKGNNSHDEPGSIELLHQIEPNVFAYEYPVVLGMKAGAVKQHVFDLLRDEHRITEFDYIVSLVPYPTKASLLIEDSIDNNNANFIEKFEQIFEHIGEVTQPYTCPKLLAFHGNVVGSRLSSGQTLVSQDIMVAPSTLEKAKHDYYALGHIHLRQFFKPNMGYSGSIYNKNWGETEQKSFETIEFEDGNMITITIPLNAARPMVKIDAEFINGRFEWDESITTDEANANAEFRFRCTVSENDRKLISDDKIEWLKTFFGKDVKIEFNIIPDQRESRSEKIMNCKTLLDEVKEYASVIEQPINGTIEQKVLELQEKGVEVQ
ncbi:MAG: metallophosphoesterase [Ignavibacterium sp.]|nr:metallophosphoesterase [Ignavibacterium sp.]